MTRLSSVLLARRATMQQMKKQGTATKWDDARQRARPVAPSRTHRGDSPAASGAVIALPFMAAYSATIVWTVWTRLLPWWVLPALALVNLLTFFAYWKDKYAAGKGNWRISESALHLWSLAGGWPGAWFAQQLLRHKSRKESFRAAYWATVVTHCAALGGWVYWVMSS